MSVINFTGVQRMETMLDRIQTRQQSIPEDKKADFSAWAEKAINAASEKIDQRFDKFSAHLESKQEEVNSRLDSAIASLQPVDSPVQVDAEGNSLGSAAESEVSKVMSLLVNETLPAKLKLLDQLQADVSSEFSGKWTEVKSQAEGVLATINSVNRQNT